MSKISNVSPETLNEVSHCFCGEHSGRFTGFVVIGTRIATEQDTVDREVVADGRPFRSCDSFSTVCKSKSGTEPTEHEEEVWSFYITQTFALLMQSK